MRQNSRKTAAAEIAVLKISVHGIFSMPQTLSARLQILHATAALRGNCLSERQDGMRKDADAEFATA